MSNMSTLILLIIITPKLIQKNVGQCSANGIFEITSRDKKKYRFNGLFFMLPDFASRPLKMRQLLQLSM